MRKIIFSFHVMLTTHSIQQSKCFLSNHLFSCFLLLSSFCRFSSVCISIIMFILWKYYLFLSIFLFSLKLVYYFLSTGWSLFFRYRLIFHNICLAIFSILYYVYSPINCLKCDICHVGSFGGKPFLYPNIILLNTGFEAVKLFKVKGGFSFDFSLPFCICLIR